MPLHAMNDAGKLQRSLSGELNKGLVSLSGEFDKSPPVSSG